MVQLKERSFVIMPLFLTIFLVTACLSFLVSFLLRRRRRRRTGFIHSPVMDDVDNTPYVPTGSSNQVDPKTIPNVIALDVIPETSDTEANTCHKGWGENKELRMFDQAKEEEGCRQIVEALTYEELEAIVNDQNMPMRHFRADKGDIAKAITRTKYAIKWRQEFGVEKILKASFNPTTDEEIEIRAILMHESSSGKMYVRNHDKENRAVLYMFPVKENTHHPENNIIHLVYQIERAIACTEKNGLEKVVVIMDFKDWKMKDSGSMATTRETIRILQECYAERLARLYFTNTPLIFRAYWLMVKVFVDPVTKAKIVFGTSQDGQEELNRYFDKHKIEKCAHGTGEWKGFNSDEYYATPLDTTFDELE